MPEHVPSCIHAIYAKFPFAIFVRSVYVPLNSKQHIFFRGVGVTERIFVCILSVKGSNRNGSKTYLFILGIFFFCHISTCIYLFFLTCWVFWRRFCAFIYDCWQNVFFLFHVLKQYPGGITRGAIFAKMLFFDKFFASNIFFMIGK